MVQIRKVEIKHFRGIEFLEWFPSSRINCLIGPGDSGKSSILDAIDWCLGARRSLPVSDADFWCMEVDTDIEIEVTIGSLSDGLKSLEPYGPYLIGISPSKEIEEEPGEGLETALAIRLTIGNDLEPHWSLVSPRAEAQGLSRGLSWSDRIAMAPVRIGTYATQHLGWQKGSILNSLTDEKADAGAELAKAARSARESFGDSASTQLEETLKIVTGIAESLGIDVGDEAVAMLDAQSVSFSGGTISLHDNYGVPLRKLGLGSSRLLVAGLQNHLAKSASIALVDEVEIGLEPHRIAKFLLELGTKNDDSKIQVFMTSHSPVVLRELTGDQLFVVRHEDEHSVKAAGTSDPVQGTLRHAPEAFLGTKVLICEGATEVGLIRGLDRYRSDNAQTTFASCGGVLVDAGGVTKLYRYAQPFLELGYTSATLRDDDVQPKEDEEAEFKAGYGSVFKWTQGWSIEEELFDCVNDEAVKALWKFASKHHGKDLVLNHLRSAADAAIDITDWFKDLTSNKRQILAKAASLGKWFKRISLMEEAAFTIIAPSLNECRKPELLELIEEIYSWACQANE